MKQIPYSSGRLFKVGSSSYLYPDFIQSEGLRVLYRAVLKFLVAATRQFWFFFSAWGAGVVVIFFRLQSYAVWVVLTMAIMLAVITVMEWSKLSEQEKKP